MMSDDDFPIGPWVSPQFAVYVPPDRFADTVPWIMQNRAFYDVMVHPNSGCLKDDHIYWSIWGGDKWQINANLEEMTPRPVPPSPNPAPPVDVRQCKVCAHYYDAEADGEGLEFDDLPESWTCPVCGAPKSAYEIATVQV